MDINDIKNRLAMLEVSLKKQLEPSKPYSTVAWNDKTGEFITSIHFGTRGMLEMQREVYALISELASLKDILKIQMNSKGLDQELVEKAIDSSFNTQLLIDINNEYKHGSPIRHYRSGKRPKLINISEGLEVPPGEQFSLDVEYFSGMVKLNKNLSAKIVADVVDGDGTKFCTLDEIVKGTVALYRQFISQQGLG